MPKYFRYYYAVAESEKRLIIGKYIAVHLMPSVRVLKVRAVWVSKTKQLFRTRLARDAI